MVKLAEVRKFAREFSHGLDLNKELKFLTVKIQLISKYPFDISNLPKNPALAYKERSNKKRKLCTTKQ